MDQFLAIDFVDLGWVIIAIFIRLNLLWENGVELYKNDKLGGWRSCCFFCFLVLIERFVLLVHEVSLNKISAIPLVSFLLVLRIKLSSTCYHCIDFTVTFWLVHYLISRLYVCKSFTGQYHVHPYERKCWIYDYGLDSLSIYRGVLLV